MNENALVELRIAAAGEACGQEQCRQDNTKSPFPLRALLPRRQQASQTIRGSRARLRMVQRKRKSVSSKKSCMARLWAVNRARSRIARAVSQRAGLGSLRWVRAVKHTRQAYKSKASLVISPIIHMPVNTASSR